MTAHDQTSRDSWSARGLLELVRQSAVPYLAVIVVATVLAPYTHYLIRSDILLRGQPLYIATELLAMPVAAILWLLYQGTATRSRHLWWLLGAAGAAWIIRMSLMVLHGDQFNHLVWLFPVFILMLWIKTPSWQDARCALVILAYALAFMLLSAYLLEVAAVLDPLYLPEEITEFQKEQYWLPLDGLPGLDGRWTGPLGHNTRAGAAAAVIFVIGAARWSRVSVPLLLVGGFFLLATSVRASYLSAAAGVAIVLLFMRRGALAQLPSWPRWLALGVVVSLGGLGMLVTGAGLTGRENIWPAFAGLVPTSPVTGVGGSGISEAGGLIAISGDAHNILLDEVVRFGFVGLLAFTMFLAAVAFLSFQAANSGFTMSAAIFATYFVASITDVQNDWLQLSYHVPLVLLGAVAAGTWAEHHTQRAA